MVEAQKFDKDKFDRLVLYICAKVENPAKLGAVKLHKILWFSDLANFARTGKSITGDTFIKMPQGPFSVHVESSVKRLERDSMLAQRNMPVFNRVQRQFFALKEPDLKGFTADEISTVDGMISAIALGHTAASISEFSHNRIWEIANLQEALPLSTVFAFNLADPEEATLEWVEGALDIEDVNAAQASFAS